MTRLQTLALLLTLAASALAHAASDFHALVQALPSASFSKKADLVDQIVATAHPRAREVLAALLEGDLHETRSGHGVVVERDEAGVRAVYDAATGTPRQDIGEGELLKIKTNNRLRKHVRGALAGLDLFHEQADKRLAAAQALLATPDESSTPALRQALERETVPRVRNAMRLGLAATDIDSHDLKVRLAAVEQLSGSLRPEVLGLLTSVADDDGRDETVRQAARVALDDIDTQRWLYRQAENLFFGLSLGSVLLLAAIGLAVTFGVMGVINMAHGEMVMLGAYTTYVVQMLMPGATEYSLLMAVPAAFAVTALVGVLIERSVIRFLYGRPLETLLATFGLSLILQQTVRTIFSPLNRSVSTPQWMSGALELNPALALTWNRIYVIVFAFAVLAGLALLLARSRFGLEVRAVTQNRAMARAMGIRTARIDAMTFGLGSGIAGIAGVALSQITNVGPNMGQAYIVDSFMVVVFGGVGNLLGTFTGAMTLGIANKFLEPVTGAVMAKIVVLVCIIVFIQRRPQGMFALRGRVAD